VRRRRPPLSRSETFFLHADDTLSSAVTSKLYQGGTPEHICRVAGAWLHVRGSDLASPCRIRSEEESASEPPTPKPARKPKAAAAPAKKPAAAAPAAAAAPKAAAPAEAAAPVAAKAAPAKRKPRPPKAAAVPDLAAEEEDAEVSSPMVAPQVKPCASCYQ
jgi:hypothetical protein